MSSPDHTEPGNSSRPADRPPSLDDLMVESIGRMEFGVIGPYRIRELIGRGGMGVVYLAEHQEQGTTVALKLVLSDLASTSRSVLRRFDREVQAIARLSSPHVVQLLDHGEHAGQPYLAMEHVAGISLEEAVRGLEGREPDGLHGRDLYARIAERWQPEDSPDGEEPGLAAGIPAFFDRPWPEVVLAILSQVALAVVHAHACGVVHRDLKPANVMLTATGQVKVLDFGLAILAGTTRFTSTGAAVGSLPYLSPEQIQGRPQAITATADVYSLGVMMYELLTLRLPYRAENAPQTMERILQGTPARPRSLNPALSLEVERVCLKAMDVDSRHRYARSRELREDLRRLTEGRSIQARAPALLRRIRRWFGRHPRVAIAASALLLTGVSFGAWYVERDRHETTESRVRDQAVERRRQAQETAARLLDMSRSLLAEMPGHGQEARLESIVAAVDLFEPVVREDPENYDSRRTWGRLHRELGNRLNDVGRYQDALVAFQTSEEVLRRCVEADPDDWVARADLAASHHGRSISAMATGDFALAVQAMGESLAHFDELVARHPGHEGWVSARLAALGTRVRTLRLSPQEPGTRLLLRTAEEGRAVQHLVSGSALLRDAYLTTMVEVALGHVDAFQLQDAEEVAREVIQVVDSMPDVAGDRQSREILALCADIQARAAEARSPRDPCDAHHERAIELERSLMADFPGNPVHKSNLASHLNNRGVCRTTRDDARGLEDLEQALALLDQVLRDHPDRNRFRDLHARTSVNLARAHLDHRPEEALRRSLAGLARFSDGNEFQGDHARQSAAILFQTAAIAYARLGRMEEGFVFMEDRGNDAAGGHPWYTRLVADAWNEWCMEYGRSPDSALAVEAELAEERMFEFLQRAVEAGYDDLDELLSTPTLEAYRDDDRFVEILADFEG